MTTDLLSSKICEFMKILFFLSFVLFSFAVQNNKKKRLKKFMKVLNVCKVCLELTYFKFKQNYA